MYAAAIISLIFTSQFVMAFSGQPKTLETTYIINSVQHGVTYTTRHTYRITLPDFNLNQFHCGHIVGVPETWDHAWCEKDKKFPANCSFLVSAKNKDGVLEFPWTFDLVTKGLLSQYNTGMFSATQDCSNGKINSKSIADLNAIHLRGFLNLDYTTKQPDPSPDPTYERKFCVEMYFSQSADPSKHRITAYRCDRFEEPNWKDIETTTLDYYK
jgi:hypothetical protein